MTGATRRNSTSAWMASTARSAAWRKQETECRVEHASSNISSYGSAVTAMGSGPSAGEATDCVDRVFDECYADQSPFLAYLEHVAGAAGARSGEVAPAAGADADADAAAAAARHLTTTQTLEIQ